MRGCAERRKDCDTEMENFDFCFDTHFVFERNVEQRSGEFCKKYSDRVFLLDYSGGTAEQQQLHNTVKISLESAGITVFEMGGVVPNPLRSFAEKAISLCKEKNIGLVLAVGGGSVIDTAKCIAVGALYDGDVWQDFYVGKQYPDRWLPFGAIPTIAAAGSEGSVASIMVDDATGQKYAFKPCPRPTFALINPELTYSVPAYHTACGAVDIMSHGLERYFTNTKQCDMTDGMIEGLLRTVIKNAPVLMKEPENYDARAELSWAAVLAQCDLLNTGRISDWSSHNIEHEVAHYYHTAHGAGLAIVFPAWMQYVYRHDPERFAQYAVNVWGVPRNADDPEGVALEGIRRTKAFFKSLDMPTGLKDIGADDRNCRNMARDCIALYGTLGQFVRLGEDDVYQILMSAVE